MPDETNSATLEPVVDDSSFEAWEASQPKAVPAQPPKAEEKPKPSVPAKGETAAAPEAAPTQEQKPKQQAQQQQPKRKHDAESRIDELTRKLKERDQELESYRKNSAPQVSQPAPEAKQPASVPERLGKLSEYVKAEHLKRPDVLQEDLIEEWVTKRETEAEQTRQAKASQERFQQSIKDLKAKRPDVDPEDVFGTADGRKQGIVLGTREANVMRDLIHNFPNWPDVLYYLHDNPEVYSQIRSVSPQEQWFDVVAIARQLARGNTPFAQAPAAETPAQEQPKSNIRPISRIPAPQKHLLGGGMSPSGKDPKDARDFEEYEPLERKRMSGGR